MSDVRPQSGGAALAECDLVARIRTARHSDLLRVTITGRLTRADMGRLEHACAPALIHDRPRLEIDLTRVTVLDPMASAVVQHMVRRGVRILKRRSDADAPSHPHDPSSR